LVAVWEVVSLLIQVTLPPDASVRWKDWGEYAIAAVAAPETMSMSAAPVEIVRRMTPAPIAPTTSDPMTKPMTATVSKPPTDCGLARYRFCARPFLPCQKARRPPPVPVSPPARANWRPRYRSAMDM